MLFLLTSVVSFFVTSRARFCILAAIILGAVTVTVILLACRRKPYAILCVCLSAVLMVAACVSSLCFFHKRDLLREYYGQDCTIEATVISVRYADVSISGYDVIVTRLNDKPLRHKAVLDCTYETYLDPGTVIVDMVAASGFDRSSASFNEELTMLSDGVFIRYEANDQNTQLITETDRFHSQILLQKWNKKLSSVIARNVDGEAGNLAAALLLGNRDLLDSTTKRDFSRAGVSHILALSGMHMTVIMGAFAFLLRRLIASRRTTSILLIALAVFYLFLTGCSVSAARAVIMLCFVYLAFLAGGNADPLTFLAVSGVLLFLISPGTVADAGFWMSFSATFGLLVYQTEFNRYLQRVTEPIQKHKLLRKGILTASSLVSASVFALIPLLAVMCVFIKETSLWAIPSSFLLAIPTELLLILSMIYLPISFVPFLSKPVGTLLAWIGNGMLDYCADISDLHNASVSLNYPFATPGAVIIIGALACSLIFRAKTPLRSLIPFALSVLLFVGAGWVYDTSEKGTVKATYVNASSTADMLVLTSDREAVICDIGSGSYDSYSQALDEVYAARATEIKAIMLTRYSHLLNARLGEIFKAEKVRQIWVPYPNTEAEYHKLVPLKKLAERYGVEVFVYKNGDDFALFDLVHINSYRYLIDRSVVPISVITVRSRNERLTYYSPAFNEAELPEEVWNTLRKSQYLIFGNKGPVTKTDYTIPKENRSELIVFADELRAARFVTDGIINTAYVMAPDRLRVYLRK